jgi:O-succinylbenzoic acid--CoA ligase
VPRLIAIAAPPGPLFLRELTRAWEDGDAVLPVDPRMPVPAAKALLEAMRPAALVDEAGTHQPLQGAAPTEDGDALVVATSGTTGDPKGVILTMDAVRASAEATSRRLQVDPERDTWLSILPVAHIGGLSVITRALLTDTPVVFEGQATLTAVVPTQANRMDLSQFRVVLVGGSADWRERPDNVVRTYGMTETGSGLAYDGVPLDTAEVRVGDDGGIHVRGPMLFRAYRHGTDPKSGDGWFDTGDVGAFDDEGRLAVQGRRGDVIVTGGEKVWPEPVERAIRELSEVEDVAVVGRPDDEWGQRVVACIVVTHGASLPSLDQVRDHVRTALPAWCAPKEVELVESVPRTPLGKIRRSEIR